VNFNIKLVVFMYRPTVDFMDFDMSFDCHVVYCEVSFGKKFNVILIELGRILRTSSVISLTC